MNTTNEHFEITNTGRVESALFDYLTVKAIYDAAYQAELEAVNEKLKALKVDVDAHFDELSASVHECGGYKGDVGEAWWRENMRYEYPVEKAEAALPANMLPLVITRAVNVPALEGLLKGKLVTAEQYDACRTGKAIKPSFIVAGPKAKKGAQ